MHSLATCRLLKEHFLFGADIACIEIDAFLLTKIEQTLAPHLFLCIIYYVRYAQRRRSRTFAVREHVQLCHIYTVKKLVALLETLRSFASTAYHNVDADERIGHLLLYKFYLVCKECLVIATVHQLKHFIRSALQRHMEVRHECTTLRTKLYQFIAQKVRLHTAYTIALYSLHLVKGLAQVEETLTSCLSEVADVHTG